MSPYHLLQSLLMKVAFWVTKLHIMIGCVSFNVQIMKFLYYKLITTKHIESAGKIWYHNIQINVLYARQPSPAVKNAAKLKK